MLVESVVSLWTWKDVNLRNILNAIPSNYLNNSVQLCIKEFCTRNFGDFEISKSI